MTQHPDQLGFDMLLASAEADNQARVFDRKTAHLPDTIDAAIACHRDQIERHHAAMLACDFDAAIMIRNDAYLLAKKLDTEKRGILASDDAPGCVLARTLAAPPGAIPLWGQDGQFTLETAGMTMEVMAFGMFGICAKSMTYTGFEVRAVDASKPFLSETGYRSFLGATVPPEPGMTTEDFVRRVIETYVREGLKGKLLRIME